MPITLSDLSNPVSTGVVYVLRGGRVVDAHVSNLSYRTFTRVHLGKFMVLIFSIFLDETNAYPLIETNYTGNVI